MGAFKNIKSKIINSLEKEFNFSKRLVHSEEFNKDIEVYIKKNDNFVLCVNVASLNSYVDFNREICSFLNLNGMKYSLVNIFFVPSISDIENVYFQTEFYEEAIFIEEGTGKIKSFNVHNVGLLNVIKNMIEDSTKTKNFSKNNYLTIFIILISIVVYFIIGIVNENIVSIRDEVLLWAGAKMDVLIRSGEYSRIFTSPFLHKNFVQLLVGIITLFFTGSIVEKNIGKRSYVILLFLGIFFGNFISYLFNFANVLGVGLYVINYSMIGALFILAFRYRNKVNRLFFIFIFAFIILNVVNSVFLNNIDNVGSLASFITGIVFTKLLYSFKK